jgi:hypothetical protein
MLKNMLMTFTLVIMLFPLTTLANSIESTPIDWNDALTQEVLKERGRYIAISGSIDQLLQAERFVESERLKRSGVRILEKNQSMAALPGMEGMDGMAEYAMAMEVDNPGGGKMTLVREMSPDEVQKMRIEQSGLNPQDVADLMTGMSDTYMMLGAAMRQGIADAGFGGLLGDEADYGKLERDEEDSKPTGKLLVGKELCTKFLEDGKYALSDEMGDEGVAWQQDEGIMLAGIGKDGKLYPLMYMFGPACMLAATASHLENIEDVSPDDYAKAQRAAAEEAAQYASIAGKEVIDGQETTRIDIADLGMTEQLEDGRTVNIDSMSFWIDEEYYKRRKFRMEGTMVENGKPKDFFMEREFQDYRRVGDSYLYEPYLQIMRVGGMLSDKERKELAKAQKELAKAEEQFKSMPAAQRAMMEKMMGPQMEQLRSLANGGAIEMKIITTSININPDMGQPLLRAMAMPNGEAPNRSVLQLIQGYLEQLGYDPGPATGQLNQQTEIAISQYQAEKGMEVTGLPSPQLAGILQAEVDAL